MVVRCNGLTEGLMVEGFTLAGLLEAALGENVSETLGVHDVMEEGADDVKDEGVNATVGIALTEGLIVGLFEIFSAGYLLGASLGRIGLTEGVIVEGFTV